MSLTGEYADDLSLALRIADHADKLTMDGYQKMDLAVELKEDDSPVTVVDRDAEQLIRALLEKERPGDGVYGEEYGSTGGGARQWILDPVDGTKNFIRRVPVWATLIALLDEGRPVVGVVSAPALKRRWFAARGDGAWTGTGVADGVRLQVSPCGRLDQASLSYSSLTGWEARGLLEPFLNLTRAMWRTRAFGDFWSYMMVAEGAVEVATEPELSLWDMAALVPIVEEAGGRMTSLDGTPAPFGTDALATNGLLHAEVMARLAGSS